MRTLYAAKAAEAHRENGDWAFVDIGFASNARSCGIAVNDDLPIELTFADLQIHLLQLARASDRPLNLVLEAPLSVAFSAAGNPTGRAIETRDGKARYWYFGLGCGVLVAATYLLRALYDGSRERDVNLYEGLVSFKPKKARSSHAADVLAMRGIVWQQQGFTGRVVAPEELRAAPLDRLQSAFVVAGFDLGIPPVIAVGPPKKILPSD